MAIRLSSPFKDQLIALVEGHYPGSFLGISESWSSSHPRSFLSILMTLDSGTISPEWGFSVPDTSQASVDAAYEHFLRTMTLRLRAGRDPFKVNGSSP